MFPRPFQIECDFCSNSAIVHGLSCFSVAMPHSLVKMSRFPSGESRGLYSRAGVVIALAGNRALQDPFGLYLTELSELPSETGRLNAPMSTNSSPGQSHPTL